MSVIPLVIDEMGISIVYRNISSTELDPIYGGRNESYTESTVTMIVQWDINNDDEVFGSYENVDAIAYSNWSHTVKKEDALILNNSDLYYITEIIEQPTYYRKLILKKSEEV